MENKKRKRSDLSDSSQISGKSPDPATAESDAKRAKLETAATVPLNTSGNLKPVAVAATNDNIRNKVQTRLFESLTKSLTATPPSKDKFYLGADDIAVSVEEAMFLFNNSDSAGKAYASHYQMLCLRLVDANNLWLRDAVFSGAMTASQLASMSAADLASPEQKKKLKAMEEEIMAKKRIEKKKATSTAFTCKKCHQSLVHYFQLQTRSADEPMTTFIECINCGNSWKM